MRRASVLLLVACFESLIAIASDCTSNVDVFSECVSATRDFTRDVPVCTTRACLMPSPCAEEYANCYGIQNDDWTWENGPLCCSGENFTCGLPSSAGSPAWEYQQCVNVEDPLKPSPQISQPYNTRTYWATTTSFSTGKSACGSITANVLDELQDMGYLPIATSTAMMFTPAAASANCTFSGTCDTPSCKPNWWGNCDSGNPCQLSQIGACYCGKGNTEAIGTATANMGCFTCAKGSFLNTISTSRLGGSSVSDAYFPGSACARKPGWGIEYDPTMPDGKEYWFVVIDSCPYAPQPQWCSANAGDTNQCGAANHFDLYNPQNVWPSWDHNYVSFDVESCPKEITELLQEYTSKCDSNH